jgi:hypothetical protein
MSTARTWQLQIGREHGGHSNAVASQARRARGTANVRRLGVRDPIPTSKPCPCVNNGANEVVDRKRLNASTIAWTSTPWHTISAPLTTGLDTTTADAANGWRTEFWPLDQQDHPAQER